MSTKSLPHPWYFQNFGMLRGPSGSERPILYAHAREGVKVA